MNTLVMIAPIPGQVQAAKALGVRSIVVWDFADAKAGFYKQMAEGCRSHADSYLECDLRATNSLLKCLQSLSAEGVEDFEIFHGGMDHFFKSYFEAATLLNKVKNTAKTVAVFSDKSALRNLLERSPRLKISTVTVRTADELANAMKQRKGPVIVKPAQSFGSKDIFLVRTKDDEQRTECALAEQFPRTLMVEEFFDGDQFSVEAITVNGEHRVLGITAKFPVLPPHFVEVGGIFPAPIDRDSEATLISATKELLDLAGLKDGVTHTEIILSSSRPVIVESHLRAGGLIPFMMNASFGLSMHEVMVASVFANVPVPVPSKNEVSILSILEFPTGRVLNEVKGRETLANLPFVAAHNVWAQPGQRLVKPSFNNERHGYVVVSGPTLAEAQKNLKIATETLQPVYEESCG